MLIFESIIFYNKIISLIAPCKARCKALCVPIVNSPELVLRRYCAASNIPAVQWPAPLPRPSLPSFFVNPQRSGLSVEPPSVPQSQGKYFINTSVVISDRYQTTQYFFTLYVFTGLKAYFFHLAGLVDKDYQ